MKMDQKENIIMPDLFSNQKEKLLKLKNQYINPSFPIKRSSLSSKVNPNHQDAKINIADIIDINKKIQKLPDKVFSYRSISLNKPDSRASMGVNSREAKANNVLNIGIQANQANQPFNHNQIYHPPHLYNNNNANSNFGSNRNVNININEQIANFPSQLSSIGNINNANNNLNKVILNNNFNNIGNIKFDNYHIVNDESSNQLFSSFKNLNHGYHSNNSKFQPVNPLNRNILSGNAANNKVCNSNHSNNNNHNNNINKQGGVDKIKNSSFKNIFSNSISINQLDFNKPNHGLINNIKKPNTTTKLEMTSNFFFGGNSNIKEYAFKEEQNTNHRKNMEDYTKIIDNFQGDKTKVFFGVFDGHGGAEVAKIAKDKLPENLAKMLADPKLTIENAITNSFKKTDDEFKIYDNVGTTACIVYITIEKDKRVIFSANIGDSRTVLVKATEAKRISYDHKCSDVKEIERIKHSGGIIFGGRVFGQLALTRAFGDFGLKNYGVCPIPYISKNIIEEEDRYIVMGSDGIWDVINEELLHTLSLNVKSADEFCKIILKNALNLGSMDNISCIVIKLN